MITETGRVVAVESDCVWVETIQQSTCGSCSAQKGCGHGLLNAAAESNRGARRNHLRALFGDSSPEQFKIDDVVQISIPEQVLVRGALLAYIMPLLLMLALAALADHFLGGDVYALLGAVVGLVAGFGLVKWHAIHNRDDIASQATVLPNRDSAVQCITPR